MAGFLKPSPSLSKLSRESRDLVDILLLAGSKIHEIGDDRALAILEMADFERTLEQVLVSKLVPLNKDEFRGIFGSDMSPLGSLSAKTKIAWAIGVFGIKTRNEIDRLRILRNVFAHAAKPIFFSTDAIKEECKKFITPSRVDRPAIVEESAPWPPTNPRHQFYWTARELNSALGAILFPDVADLSDRQLTPLD